jgi:hypothetical protein
MNARDVPRFKHARGLQGAQVSAQVDRIACFKSISISEWASVPPRLTNRKCISSRINHSYPACLLFIVASLQHILTIVENHSSPKKKTCHNLESFFFQAFTTFYWRDRAKQAPWTKIEREQLEWHTHTHTETHTHLPVIGLNKHHEQKLKEITWNDTHTHTPRHTHTYHQHIDCDLYTNMTSYLPQVYRQSIIIDKPTLLSIVGW